MQNQQQFQQQSLSQEQQQSQQQQQANQQQPNYNYPALKGSLKSYKVVEQYVIDKDQLLGKGSFGSVYSGQDRKNNLQVAVKSIAMDLFTSNQSKVIQNIKNEIRNMQILHHPNIVKLYDVKKTAHNLYLIMEYCNNGNLERLLQKNHGRLSELQAIKLIKELVQGFRTLYSSQIVHRDLKPANILIHDGEVKISDFGFSKVVEAGMEENVLQSYVGSPQYMSPQILGSEQYSSKTDVWSLGLIIFEMLYGKLPWSGKNPNDLLDNIEKFQLKFPDTPNVSQNLKQIIKQMLVIDEKQRISWEDIFKIDIFLENEELSQSQISESLKTVYQSYKNDLLNRAKALAKIYFEANYVITNPYDCAKKDKINKFMLQNFNNNENGQQIQNFQKQVMVQLEQQNNQNQQQFQKQQQQQQEEIEEEKIQIYEQTHNNNTNLLSNQHTLIEIENQSNQNQMQQQQLKQQPQLQPKAGQSEILIENISQVNQTTEEQLIQIFSQQKIQKENKSKIEKVSDNFIYRRNLASFLITVAIQIYDAQHQFKLINNSLFYRAVFMLLKRPVMILFKMYLRMKQQEGEKYPEKYIHFQKEDFDIFIQSQEKNLLQNFIKQDLHQSKFFFDEFLNLIKNVMKTRKDLENQEDFDKIQDMKDIFNNALHNKEGKHQFQQFWFQNLSELQTQLFSQITQNKNLQVKSLIIPAFYLKLLVEMPENFKFNFETNKKIDFQKLLEDIELMNSETLYQKLQLQHKKNNLIQQIY